MATNLVVNGVSFAYPDTGDQSWGAAASAWAAAVTTGTLQKSGGAFTLTADVNLGINFGILSKYFTSTTASPSATGVVRLANTDGVVWRNAAASGDLALKPNVSTDGVLTYNGVDLSGISLTQTLTNKTIDASANTLSNIVNANISGSAAIAYSKLSLSGSILNADINSAAAIAYSKLSLTGSILNADINSSAAIAYSKLALTGNILNADINASAAIAYSKLNLATSILNADISASAAIAYSKLNLSTSILNADISASAAIAYSKLNLSASVATTDLVNNAVTNAKAAQMAANTIKGNNTAGTANAVDMTVAQLTALVGVTASTASTLAERDANANLAVNNLLEAGASTATAAGTTTLVVGSAYFQQFTGTTTQTVVLPAANTLTLYQAFAITNRSTGVVTVNANGGGLLQAMAAGSQATFTVTNIGTGAGTWDVAYSQTAAITSPLTTKGDLFGFSTVNARLPVGTDTWVLTADSSQTLGVKWAAAAAAGATSVLSKTANYSMVAADQVILADATGGAITITLPPPATNTKPLYIKNVSTNANAVTIARNSTEKIDTATASKILLTLEAVVLISNATDWFILA